MKYVCCHGYYVNSIEVIISTALKSCTMPIVWNSKSSWNTNLSTVGSTWNLKSRFYVVNELISRGPRAFYRAVTPLPSWLKIYQVWRFPKRCNTSLYLKGLQCYCTSKLESLFFYRINGHPQTLAEHNFAAPWATGTYCNFL